MPQKNDPGGRKNLAHFYGKRGVYSDHVLCLKPTRSVHLIYQKLSLHMWRSLPQKPVAGPQKLC